MTIMDESVHKQRLMMLWLALFISPLFLFAVVIVLDTMQIEATAHGGEWIQLQGLRLSGCYLIVFNQKEKGKPI